MYLTLKIEATVTGRIGTANESDYFRFEVGEADADRLLSLRIETAPPAPLEFCLRGEDGARLQCRRATAPVELPDLLLLPGDWVLSVARARQGTQYTITLGHEGPVQPGVEAEPPWQQSAIRASDLV